jgi:hypothetical protein
MKIQYPYSVLETDDSGEEIEIERVLLIEGAFDKGDASVGIRDGVEVFEESIQELVVRQGPLPEGVKGWRGDILGYVEVPWDGDLTREMKEDVAEKLWDAQADEGDGPDPDDYYEPEWDHRLP